jgi:DNA-binding XRE family transcriptional regulator
VDLPGICCASCETVIVKGRGPWLHNGPVFCLPCLAKTPEAPFGQRLKAHRLAAGLTLRQLGKRVGMAGTYLGNLEQGHKRHLWTTIVKLIRVFGLSLVDVDNELASSNGKP